jgi:hypothetical protein
MLDRILSPIGLSISPHISVFGKRIDWGNERSEKSARAGEKQLGSDSALPESGCVSKENRLG